MRTKTILLTAAAALAGVASSNAQVFSVNAVGYVNKTVPAGKFALISNPLNAANNTIGELFKTVPAGTALYKFKADGSGWDQGAMDEFSGTIEPATFASQNVSPGEGIFVRNLGTTDLTVTFVGEVMQGNLTNPIPAGLSVRSSQVPVAGNGNALGIPGVSGDTIYKWDVAAQSYGTFAFDEFDNKWPDSAAAEIAVGEAVFLQKTAAASWTRTFNVNQ